ncbi:MAG: ABC1 kinase family protein [Armatimonadota bacterium]
MLKQELIVTELVPRSGAPKVPIVEPAPPSRFRALTQALYVLGWLIGALWLKLTGRNTPRAAAQRLRRLLERMGGLWVKAGQLISLRADLFSTEFCNELAKLQYEATGFPSHVARQIVESELGMPLEEVFDEFDPLPFAAASISQVHRARLRREGCWVAVKVQRPDVSATFARDLAMIQSLVGLYRRLNILGHLRWGELIWEIRQIMIEETDYRYEESNLRRMKKTLREHKVYIPKVFTRYSTQRVLVMEYITGTLMSTFIAQREKDPMGVQLWLQENNIDPELLGKRLLNSFLRQLLEDNLFHGDLHPGNIVLLRNSRMAFIDLGTVGSFDNRFLNLYRLLMFAIGSGDYAKATDILLMMCESIPPIDLTQVRGQMVREYRAWAARARLEGLPYHEKSISNMGAQTGRVMYQHGIIASWQFFKATRTLATLDASLSFLIPDLDYGKLVYKYQRGADRRTLNRFLSAGVSRLASGLINQVGELAMYQGSVLRRQAQVFEGVTTKAADVFAFITRTISRVMILGVALGIFAWVEQHDPEAVDHLTKYPVFDAIADFFPNHSHDVWVLVVVGIVVACWLLNRIARRLSQKEIPVPGTGRP